MPKPRQKSTSRKTAGAKKASAAKKGSAAKRGSSAPKKAKKVAKPAKGKKAPVATKAKKVAKTAAKSKMPPKSAKPTAKPSKKAVAPASKPTTKTKPAPAKAAPAKAAPAKAAAKKMESPKSAKTKGRSVAPVAANGSKEGLKARFAALSSATSKISGMKRSIGKNFFEVGTILNHIRHERLYEVKGYGSFESFVEREIDISKVVCLRSARIAEAMIRDVALEAGLERSSAAVAALDGEEAPSAPPSATGRSGNVIPLHKQ